VFDFSFLVNLSNFVLYRVFQGFGQSKFANGGVILRSRQFLLLPQLPQKNEAHITSGQK